VLPAVEKHGPAVGAKIIELGMKKLGLGLFDHVHDAEPNFAAVMPPGNSKWVYDRNAMGKVVGQHAEADDMFSELGDAMRSRRRRVCSR
jgi:hypothetical protein